MISGISYYENAPYQIELSDILATVAIIVSVIVAIYEIYSSRKINKINIENKYFEKIFDEILLHDIPKDREYIIYLGGNLTETRRLQETMVKLRKKSLFFKYKDLDFYNKLCERVMSIEDFLFKKEGEMTREEYKSFEINLDIMLEDLYTLISDSSIR